MTPKRRSDLLILLGSLLLSLGLGMAWGLAAGLVAAGAAFVLAGLFLVTNVEGARESIPARPKRRRRKD